MDQQVKKLRKLERELTKNVLSFIGLLPAESRNGFVTQVEAAETFEDLANIYEAAKIQREANLL
jgi:hypothetical protein